MRHINPEIIDKFKQSEYIPAFMLKISLGGTPETFIRFTTWSSHVNYKGQLYYPRGFAPGAINYATSTIVSSLPLKIDDVDRFILTTFGSRGPEGYPLTLELIILNYLGSPILNESAVVFEGEVTEWSYEPGHVYIRASSILSKHSQVSTRMFSSSCSVKVFKSTQCGYVGPGKICDRTYEQCTFYNNTLNFRGFRHLPEMRTRKIEFPQD